MSIARTTDGGLTTASKETPSALPRIGVVSIVVAGLYAVIRLRDRRRNEIHDRMEVPNLLREDVGLPPREKSRGWWEWR